MGRSSLASKRLPLYALASRGRCAMAAVHAQYASVSASTSCSSALLRSRLSTSALAIVASEVAVAGALAALAAGSGAAARVGALAAVAAGRGHQ